MPGRPLPAPSSRCSSSRAAAVALEHLFERRHLQPDDRALREIGVGIVATRLPASHVFTCASVFELTRPVHSKCSNSAVAARGAVRSVVSCNADEDAVARELEVLLDVVGAEARGPGRTTGSCVRARSPTHRGARCSAPAHPPAASWPPMPAPRPPTGPQPARRPAPTSGSSGSSLPSIYLPTLSCSFSTPSATTRVTWPALKLSSLWSSRARLPPGKRGPSARLS